MKSEDWIHTAEVLYPEFLELKSGKNIKDGIKNDWVPFLREKGMQLIPGDAQIAVEMALYWFEENLIGDPNYVGEG